MIEPMNFQVGDESYQLLPHTGFVALDLDRKVAGFVGSVIASNSDNLVSAIMLAFSSMSESEFEWLVTKTLERVTVTTPGKQAFSLSNVDMIAEHFSGHKENLYAVLVKAWELEKLSPFANAPTAGN